MMDDKIILGIWIGISHKIGSDMCYWVLEVLVKFVARNTVHHMIRTGILDP